MRRSITAIAALLATSSASAETFAIQAGRLIVDAAKPERGPSTVIVDNGRIVRIDDGATAPAGATVVDMRSKTVMPGMTDVHVHLTSTAGQPWHQRLTPKYSEAYAATTGLRNALAMARAGFTTVRDLGSGRLERGELAGEGRIRLRRAPELAHLVEEIDHRSLEGEHERSHRPDA